MYDLYRQQCPPATFPYIIKLNDTLYSLARRFNTTVAAIISANPFIRPEALHIGQRICVPTQRVYPPCPEGNYYRIRPGDTLYSIAEAYNISLDDLIESNPLIDPNILMVGQVICIPVAMPPITCTGGNYYTIRLGDTFYSIARRVNVTVDALEEANPNVDPNRLLAGQVICIPAAPQPAPCSQNNYYTIVSGDTLYSIARRFNTTIRDIMALNPNINPYDLRVGQRICIAS